MPSRKIELVECEYQYDDGENYMFIDGASFAQIALALAGHEERGPYLREGQSYTLLMRGSRALDVRIPGRTVFTVARIDKRSRPDSSMGATKRITTETGLVLRVPLFIQAGERILVDTQSREYIQRAD